MVVEVAMVSALAGLGDMPIAELEKSKISRVSGVQGVF
jgi:hypothetical protein